MNSFLVTGASGMLGSHLVQCLLSQGVHIRVLVRESSDIRFLDGKTVEIVAGDTADSKTIATAMVGIEVVYHLAGYLTVDSPFGADSDNPEIWKRYKAANVDFTGALLEAAKWANVKRFVYVSSTSVYAVDVPVPTPEEAPLKPESMYGRSKLMAEKLVQEAQAQGLSTTIIRPAVIYGPGDRYFTPAAFKLARMPVLPLVEAGQKLFDMVYVADVVELLWLAWKADVADGRIYNCGAGRPTSIKKLVEGYRQLTGKGPRIVNMTAEMAAVFAPVSRLFLSRLAPGIEGAMSPSGLRLMSQDLHLDMSRAERELGFRPRYSLVKGLAETLEGLS